MLLVERHGCRDPTAGAGRSLLRKRRQVNEGRQVRPVVKRHMQHKQARVRRRTQIGSGKRELMRGRTREEHMGGTGERGQYYTRKGGGERNTE